MLRSLLLASFLVGIASVAIAAPAPAPTSTAPVAKHPGDAAAGRLMVFTCHGCHGIPGYRNAYPNYPVPKIAGQHYDYLVAALNEYRDGQRTPPTMTMNIQAKSLSEQDIRNIAAYLSSIRK
ncbi:MAG: c-type cytochrome [Metallibacterium sp.]